MISQIKSQHKKIAVGDELRLHHEAFALFHAHF